jgi:putative membrane-bound dehydrogenase-like protein
MKKLAILLAFSLCSFLSDQKEPLSAEEYAKLTDSQKRSVEHALDGIDLKDPELEISLFASEPMMTNPTNMDIDAKGRVWICEAYNYRNTLNPRNPYNAKGDRILIMEDTNNDGKADKSKVFYQGEDINAALGIAVLGNKVYVSCSPNVFVFTDENGDDIPDKKEILFSGIGGLQHDHGMHAFVFGPDGKLYFNFGNSGNTIISKEGKSYLDVKNQVITGTGKPYREGMIFRANEDGTDLEPMAWNFRNNYELALDSYGKMWQSDNDDDGNRSTRINYVMDYGNYGFKDEMTGADWRVRRTNSEDSVFYKHWHLNDPGVVPNLLQTYAGSPTGIIFYEGSLLPAKYRNQIIHCDAGPNIVRAYPTVKKGAGFSASILNILDGSKKDKWFRPSDITVAPDGSIFVSDWYDPGVGGHAMGDSLRGRIYRIAPKGIKYKVPTHDYSSAAGAAESLKSPNQAVRYLAYQSLKSMGTKAESSLKELLNDENPNMAARAYWLLAEQDNTWVNHASKNPNEDIRVLSVRMARKYLKEPYAFLNEMSSDGSMQVKREVALALRHKNYTDIWVKLASEYKGNDRWYLEALGIAADQDWDKSLELLKAKEGNNWLKKNHVKELVWRSRSTKTMEYLAEIIPNEDSGNKWKYYRAFDFQKGADKNDILFKLIKTAKSDEEKVTIFKLLDQSTIQTNANFKVEFPKLLASIKNDLDFIDLVEKFNVKSQFTRLHNLALNSSDKQVSAEAGNTSVKLHGTKGLLLELNNPKTAKRAIDKYGNVDNVTIAKELVKIYSNKKYSEEIRKLALNEMSGWESEVVLWEQLKANKIPAEYVETALSILKRTWHGDIRNEVNKMIATSDGQTINIENILKGTGDQSAGKEVFATYCVTCHVAKNTGIDFGPSLSLIGNKLSKQGLLNAVINPSEGIGFGYEAQEITMKNGDVLQAIITSKTEIDLMIKYPGSASVNILKLKDVAKIEQKNESLMPKFALNETELKNLITYMETLK